MSVHSKDGMTWLTKLERIGEIAISKKDTVFNNIGHIITLEMLEEHYHKLDGKKAIGIDNVSKQQYGENLASNLEALLICIRRGTYKPKPSRIVEIPKEDGSSRPLAISCLEDKIVQSVVNTILGKIYEPIFLPCSYGFRPEQSCHDALRALSQTAFKFLEGAIVEIDLEKYFNTIPHSVLMECLGKKISDSRFLRLIKVLIEAPIKQGDTTETNKIGCPQGSIISPVLSNIYLHYALDTWFEEIRQSHIKGQAEEVRYADDVVFVFEKKLEAERFFEVLPKRLEKFGLKINLNKSQVIASGRYAARKAHASGSKLATLNFLGFTFYWGISRNGTLWRPKYTSRSDRFREKLKKLKEFLRENLNSNTEKVLKAVIKVMRGWINYHGISDNSKRVKAFICQCERALFKWMNRRGGKRGMNWKKFTQLLKRVQFPNTWKTISMFPALKKT
jgi:group II intron reverse transcriptase/maturase